jgi:SAM-dependent methyltransferase
MGSIPTFGTRDASAAPSGDSDAHEEERGTLPRSVTGTSEPVVSMGVPSPEVRPEYSDLAAAFDAFAASDEKWRLRNRTYHRLVEQTLRFYIPRGKRVLEIGCGSGELLAALEPSDGVGVDISEALLEKARDRHPDLQFVHAVGEELDLGRTFDYIVLSDLLPFVHDLVALFQAVAAHSERQTRIVVNSYSRLWRPVIRLAELLRLKPVKPMRNWVSPSDVSNLLELCGLEVITLTRRILMPKRIPGLNTFFNGFLANLWPFNHLCVSYWIVSRPRPTSLPELTVSVVCPCRNEAGNVPELIRRLPRIGLATELVFVEGGSTDDTRAEIERQIELHPGLDISLVEQPDKGKGDAVRAGFDAAKHDLLMILDGDLSVRPEDLPKFYDAAVSGYAQLVNGSRLVYDIEPGAMRFLNVVGNKVFSWLFKAITGQHVKDTLCGTKVLRQSDYAQIAAGRAYFGEFDPFGDFDLLFGAARLNLKIVDLPVRYQPRTYGTTNISRWRHGWLLLRMTMFAFRKFRVALYRVG